MTSRARYCNTEILDNNHVMDTISKYICNNASTCHLESSFKKLWPSQMKSYRINTKGILFNLICYSEILIEFGIWDLFGMAVSFVIRTWSYPDSLAQRIRKSQA
jgi:hypothetical protein